MSTGSGENVPVLITQQPGASSDNRDTTGKIEQLSYAIDFGFGHC
jgi:hypothetical protein